MCVCGGGWHTEGPQLIGLFLCSVTLSACYPSTPSSEGHLFEVLQPLSGGSESPAVLEVQGGSHFHHHCSAKPASPREGWEKARSQRERWALEAGKTHTPSYSSVPQVPLSRTRSPTSASVLRLPPPSASPNSPSSFLPQSLCTSIRFQLLPVPPPNSYLLPPSCPPISTPCPLQVTN